jgi:hypothetical protein
VNMTMSQIRVNILDDGITFLLSELIHPAEWWGLAFFQFNFNIERSVFGKFLKLCWVEDSISPWSIVVWDKGRQVLYFIHFLWRRFWRWRGSRGSVVNEQM